MKLTKEQINEIKDQQSQVNKTKRVTAPELENILYDAMPALDSPPSTLKSKSLCICM